MVYLVYDLAACNNVLYIRVLHIKFGLLIHKSLIIRNFDDCFIQWPNVIVVYYIISQP